MMKIKTSLYMIAAACGLVLASCSDDEYQAGEEPTPYCISAFFSSTNESNLIITPEELAASPRMTLKVERMESDEAATVPVIVERKHSAFNIPSSVEFKAGEDTTSLTIEFPNLEKGDACDFVIRLGEEYVNHYAQLEGSDVFKGSVLVAQWDKLISNGMFWFEYNNYQSPVLRSNVYHLSGQNRFYIEDFMGSGVNLQFSIENDNFSVTDSTTWVGEIYPLNYVVEGGDDGYGNTYQWFANGANDPISWFPAGWDEGWKSYFDISWLGLYGGDFTTFSFSPTADGYISMTCYCIYTQTEDWISYPVIRGYWYQSSIVKQEDTKTE